MIDYEKLWNYMRKHNISQYYLIQHGIGNKTIYNIKKALDTADEANAE